MKRIGLFLFFAWGVLLGLAQSNTHFGGRSAGMAYASVTLSDVWSSHNNQAGLAWMKSKKVGVYYQNKFALKQLSNVGLAYAHPMKKGIFAVQWSHFGYSLYQENKVGLAYALLLSEKLSLGVQLDYLNTKLGGMYGSKNTLAGEVGLQAKLSSELTLGVHIYNPTRAKLNDYNQEAVPTIMRLGLGYNFSKKVLVTLETEKDIDHKPVLKAGVEYLAHKKMYVRGGVATGPTLASFGLGLNMEQYKLNIATTYHQVLGFSPELSFTYTFKGGTKAQKAE